MLLSTTRCETRVLRGAIIEGVIFAETIETAFQFLHKVELLVYGKPFVHRALPEGMLALASWTRLRVGLCSQSIQRFSLLLRVLLPQLGLTHLQLLEYHRTPLKPNFKV